MIVVVYHVYCYDDWKIVVDEQMKRLQKSGLYESADKLFMTINLGTETEESVNEFFNQYDKFDKEYHVTNAYEYPGIKKVKDFCDENDDVKILYFHTKGVSNKYRRHDRPDEISEVKVKGVASWREVLEYFVIDNWKDCILKLDDYDSVGVTCDNGWFWGNFWWSTTKHIRTREMPTPHHGRWYYEAWLNQGVQGKNYEFYKFVFNPYRCVVDKEFYDGTYHNKLNDLEIINATYGSFDIQNDEGRMACDDVVVIDVTDLILKHISEKNTFDGISVNNEPMGEDPLWGTHKQLTVTFKIKGFDKIHKIVFDEYRSTYLNFV
jgi:hypothetical protein